MRVVSLSLGACFLLICKCSSSPYLYMPVFCLSPISASSSSVKNLLSLSYHKSLSFISVYPFSPYIYLLLISTCLLSSFTYVVSAFKCPLSHYLCMPTVSLYLRACVCAFCPFISACLLSPDLSLPSVSLSLLPCSLLLRTLLLFPSLYIPVVS